MRSGTGEKHVNKEQAQQMFHESLGTHTGALLGIEVVGALPEPTVEVWSRAADMNENDARSDGVDIDGLWREVISRFAYRAYRSVEKMDTRPAAIAVMVSRRPLLLDIEPSGVEVVQQIFHVLAAAPVRGR